jgi:hypothetical protein
MTRLARLALCMTVVAIAADGAQAGVFKNVVRGLEYAGFNFVGQENPLSGGADFALTRTFNNETLDFGGTELTLNGPVAFGFSTGGRMLPVLDISLNTRNQPLEYTFTSDVGGQSTTITGSMELNATGSIDTFGFYDFRFDLSSRQSIDEEGRFRNTDGELVDFDVGPIDVSGNIFADLLGLLFDPFFESTGGTNIFASFSGRLQAEEEMNLAAKQAMAKMQAGVNLTPEEVSELVGHVLTVEALGGNGVDLSFLDLDVDQDLAQAAPVPEPGTLCLLLVAIPLLYRRRR